MALAGRLRGRPRAACRRRHHEHRGAPGVVLQRGMCEWLPALLRSPTISHLLSRPLTSGSRLASRLGAQLAAAATSPSRANGSVCAGSGIAGEAYNHGSRHLERTDHPSAVSSSPSLRNLSFPSSLCNQPLARQAERAPYRALACRHPALERGVALQPHYRWALPAPCRVSARGRRRQHDQQPRRPA